MVEDPWNPTAEEIKNWAFSNEFWPEQDWEIAVNNREHDTLLIQLASDLNCPQRAFFVHAIYFMLGDAFHGEIELERLSELKSLLEKVSIDIPPDILKWKREALELISNPENFNYKYWCQHLF